MYLFHRIVVRIKWLHVRTRSVSTQLLLLLFLGLYIYPWCYGSNFFIKKKVFLVYSWLWNFTLLVKNSTLLRESNVSKVVSISFLLTENLIWSYIWYKRNLFICFFKLFLVSLTLMNSFEVDLKKDWSQEDNDLKKIMKYFGEIWIILYEYLFECD